MKIGKKLFVLFSCATLCQINVFAQEIPILVGMGINISPTELITEYDGDSHSQEMHSLDLNFIDASIPTSPTLGFCFDLGLGHNFTWGEEKQNGITNKTFLWGANISGGLSYGIDLGTLEILPFFDICMDISCLGSNTVSGKSIKTEKTEIFGKDSDFHRTRISYKFGAKVSFGKIYLGIGRKAPITNFYNKNDVKQNFYKTEFTIGYNFASNY
ncbi:MAG: hypothetical protein MJY58_07170 [Bacteroidaceae bacterium]|nr:hypothetical protein [Bacteroidaceae bacterium]